MYSRPQTLPDSLRLLADPGAVVLGGGTDLFPAAGERALAGHIVDVGGLRDLRGIRMEADVVRIGATTTWRDIAKADLPAAFDALRAASQDVGGIQIQTRGTIAGNLCNASPAADGVPPLLALDAEVELQSVRGRRQMPLHAFLVGNRRTLRAPDELLTAILIPRAAATGQSAFLKLGARRYLVISIVMVAVRLVPDRSGHVGEARVAVGSCSATARRLPQIEAALVGTPMRPGFADRLANAPIAELTPISDLRASAGYRAAVAPTLIARALDACVAGEAGGCI